MLQYFNLAECNPTPTPSTGLELANEESGTIMGDNPYRQRIGSYSIQQTLCVRPYISYAGVYLSRVVHKPTNMLWKAGKQVLRCSSGTAGIGIVNQEGEKNR